MKAYQPLALVGFSFYGASLLSSLVPFTYILPVFYVTIILFSLTLIYFVLKGFNANRVVVLFAVFFISLGCLINIYKRCCFADISINFPTEPTTASGTIKEEYSLSGDQQSFLIKTDKIDAEGVPQKLDIVLYASKDVKLNTGEKISCNIEAFKNIPSRSQLGKGAEVACRVSGDIQVLNEADAFSTFISEVKFKLETNIKKVVSSPYDKILIAMFLGDTGEMDTELYDSFNLTGISHILCVSGFHIALITGIFMAFFKLFFGKKLLTDALAVFVTLFFVLLTGASLSSVRAFIMTVTIIFTRHVVRDYSPVNTLGGITFFFCLLSPEVVYNTGFLMSVVSVLSLYVLAGNVSKRIFTKFNIKNIFLKYIVEIFSSSVTVSVVLMPIMLIFTGYTSLLAPLINLFVLPLIPCIMITGILASLSGSSVIGDVAAFLIDKIAALSEKAGRFSISVLPLNLSYVKIWIVGTAIIIISALLMRRFKENALKIFIISASLFIVGAMTYSVINHNNLSLTFVEQGDKSSIVVHRNGKACIVNCGGNGTMGVKTAQYMRSIGISDFELLIITDNKVAKAGGVKKLTAFSVPKEVIAPLSSNYISNLYDKNCKLTEFGLTKRKILDGVLLQIEEDKISFKGNNREIFILDDSSVGILNDGEEVILKEGIKKDTLKPKYDIIDVKAIENLEKENFKALKRGEGFSFTVAKNGKIKIKGE